MSAGEGAHAEDRYKITTYNPIRTVSLNPAAPQSNPVNTTFSLTANVLIHTTVGGVLQVSAVEQSSGVVANSSCRTVASNIQQNQNFEISWLEGTTGQKTYQIRTSYRAGGTCPIDNSHPNDNVKVYQINWESDNANFSVLNPQNVIVNQNSTQNLGGVPLGKDITLVYTLHNTSSSEEITVTNIEANNPLNLAGFTINPTGPFTIQPGEDELVTLSFQVPNPEPFSVGLILDHTGLENNPFVFTLQGSGFFEIEDVVFENWGYPYVLSVLTAGVVPPCNEDPLRYCPTELTSRADLALSLELILNGADFIPEESIHYLY